LMEAELLAVRGTSADSALIDASRISAALLPAVDMPQLARQMETVGERALDDAKSRGGNCVAVSRLSTLVL